MAGKAGGTDTKKPKKKKTTICINLAHCGYPIVYRCARDMGWKVSVCRRGATAAMGLRCMASNVGPCAVADGA